MLLSSGEIGRLEFSRMMQCNHRKPLKRKIGKEIFEDVILLVLKLKMEDGAKH